MIEIHNDGSMIVSTNYWSREHARKGHFFLSWNAGTARLLVPPMQEPALADMRTAEYVIITRGPWPQAGGRMGWELLFEDHSQSPYAVHLLAEQSDRAIPPADIGRHLKFSAWTEAGLALELPARLRAAKQIPHLKPWANQGRA